MTDHDYARLCALQMQLAILNELCRLVSLQVLWDERAAVVAALHASGARREGGA